MTPVWMVKMV